MSNSATTATATIAPVSAITNEKVILFFYSNEAKEAFLDCNEMVGDSTGEMMHSLYEGMFHDISMGEDDHLGCPTITFESVCGCEHTASIVIV